MVIKSGDCFECIKDVIMISNIIKNYQVVKYTKGQIYMSDEDGCITNNKGNKKHQWHNNEDPPELYFKKLGGILTEFQEPIGVKNDSDKLPYYTVLFKQFPNALREVIKCSKAGNNKYHETDKDWMNFSRVDKSETRYKDAMLRHMLEDGSVEDMEKYGGMTHEAAVVWNALADLEIKLRKTNG